MNKISEKQTDEFTSVILTTLVGRIRIASWILGNRLGYTEKDIIEYMSTKWDEYIVAHPTRKAEGSVRYMADALDELVNKGKI